MNNVNSHHYRPNISVSSEACLSITFFDLRRFSKWLIISGITFGLVFIISVMFFGYEMTAGDLKGSLFSIPLAAFLLQMLFGVRGVR